MGGVKIASLPASWQKKAKISSFSRFIYTHFHHEPFAPDGQPEIEAGNPLSGSNQAMPYIYFERDRKIFEARFPALTVKAIRYHTPFLYLISGGLSHPSLLPGFLYRPARWMESLFAPFYRLLGLFCTIVVEKKPPSTIWGASARLATATFPRR
jgi:hypothetical protein